MSDLINRSAAMLKVARVDETKFESIHDFHDACVDCLLEVPSIERWTQCSSRTLPKLGESVLCQCRAGIYDVLKWTVDGWEKDKGHCYMKTFVIAWRPLPDPYKGG